MRRIRLFACTLGCFAFSTTVALATFVPRLDLDTLTSGADVIVVGQLVEMQGVGTKLVHVQGNTVKARSMLGELAVEKVIKGQVTENRVAFSFDLTETFVGFPGLGLNEFGVFFLRRGTTGLEVFDPYHPYVVAVADAPRFTGSYADQVIMELSHVANSKEASNDTRVKAVLALQDVRAPLATEALGQFAHCPDIRSRVLALGALLRRKDLKALSDVSELVLSRHLASAGDLVGGLEPSIGAIDDPSAVPTLTQLLEVPNVRIRRGAAAALRNTRDPKAVKPLASALFDSDQQVRYYAVVGLGEITGQNQWTPSVANFEQNEKKFLDYWREWAKENAATYN